MLYKFYSRDDKNTYVESNRPFGDKDGVYRLSGSELDLLILAFQEAKKKGENEALVGIGNALYTIELAKGTNYSGDIDTAKYMHRFRFYESQMSILANELDGARKAGESEMRVGIDNYLYIVEEI